MKKRSRCPQTAKLRAANYGTVGLLVLQMAGGNVWSQPVRRGDVAEASRAVASQPAQKRAALRAALQAQSVVQAPRAQDHAHQLNPEERAKLREQLRQQRAEPAHPGESPSK